MSTLVANCPRCPAKSMTFDVLSQVWTATAYDWQRWYEVFCVCRHCKRPSIFLLSRKELERGDPLYKDQALVEFKDSLNEHFKIERHISIADEKNVDAPEHSPPQIKLAFEEGTKCFSIGCYNASAAMFRLSLDLATKPVLPNPEADLPRPTRRERAYLAPRLKWLFENKLLPEELRELADCIREDGNDGAHDGNLTKEDATELMEFSLALFERLYTEKKRLELAQARRLERRNIKT